MLYLNAKSATWRCFAPEGRAHDIPEDDHNTPEVKDLEINELPRDLLNKRLPVAVPFRCRATTVSLYSSFLLTTGNTECK